MSKTLDEHKADVAREWAEAFKRETRADGTPYYVHNQPSDSPLYEAVYAAHGNGSTLPDDWTYEVCSDACDALNDTDPDEWDECELEADIYTQDLLAWLADGHLDEADEAMKEFGCDSILAAIQAAQAQAKGEILSTMRQAAEEEAERRHEAEEETEEAEA